jgi:signal peptidase I
VRAEVAEAEAAKKETKEAKERPPLRSRAWHEAVSWFWVIVAFLFIEGTLVQARVIPSGSMENTVLIGDHLIVSRAGYDAGIPFTNIHVPLWRNPKRQEIIVFKAPLPEQGYPDFIKRCIGVPGDHVKVAGGVVYVNGIRLKEPYVLRDPDMADSPGEDFPPIRGDLAFIARMRPQWAEELPNHMVNGELVVPPGQYFMMGDNRDNSYDGRYWGFVPRANIIGAPLFIYMSIDAPEEVWGPGHLGDRFGAYLDALVHPSEVRWRRIFHTFGSY